jgi:hypothetical protein
MHDATGILAALSMTGLVISAAVMFGSWLWLLPYREDLRRQQARGDMWADEAQKWRCLAVERGDALAKHEAARAKANANLKQNRRAA